MTTKADLNAAERLLQKAVRRAIVLTRNGHDTRSLLQTATFAAAVLMGDE